MHTLTTLCRTVERHQLYRLYRFPPKRQRNNCGIVKQKKGRKNRIPRKRELKGRKKSSWEGKIMQSSCGLRRGVRFAVKNHFAVWQMNLKLNLKSSLSCCNIAESLTDTHTHSENQEQKKTQYCSLFPSFTFSTTPFGSALFHITPDIGKNERLLHLLQLMAGRLCNRNGNRIANFAKIAGSSMYSPMPEQSAQWGDLQ